MNQYSNESIYSFPGVVVRVHFPELTDYERRKRKKELQNASIALMKDFATKSRKGGLQN